MKNKMSQPNVSTLTLEQSISFGKFENDSLSWEKWSSFSPNKYLEEVEKCSTPGSVAEKKAYFEAHYKKIAAKKAELEQDNPVQCAPARTEELNHERSSENRRGNGNEFDVCGAEKSNVEVEQIAQQKAYFEELYIKIADRMEEHVEQDTPMQYTYPVLDELNHINYTDNMPSCDYEVNPCPAENPNVEGDQIAQKKAYFEAQLKKIDGWRAERLEKDKPLSSAYHKFDESQNKKSPNASDCTFNASGGKKFTTQVEKEEVVVIKTKDIIDNISGQKQEISGGESLSTSIKETKDCLIISQSVYTEKVDPEIVGIEAKDAIVGEPREISPGECLNTSIEEAKEDHIASQSVYAELVEQEVVVSIGTKDTIVNDSCEKQEISAGKCLSTSLEESKGNLTISQSVYTGSSDSGMTLVITEEPSCVVNPSEPLKLDKKVENNAKTGPGKEAKKLKVKEPNITAKKVSAKKEQPLTGTKKKVVPSAAKSSVVSSSRSPKLAPSSPLMAASKPQPLTGTKKKLASSAAKSSPISTPRNSKLAPPSPLISASKLSSKKLNATFLPRNKNTTPGGENRRAAPTSLHMSLNLGSPDLSVEPASARKSLIMERMADKDIIKRVFSSFKNNFQELRSSYDEKSIRVSQASNVLDGKVTTLPQKDSEGLRNAADKKTPTTAQLGLFSSVAPGVVSHEENKRGKAFSPSVDSKSDEGVEKRKDFLKKLGPKSITREIEKVQIPTKSKGKDGETKLLKKNSKNPGLINSKG